MRERLEEKALTLHISGGAIEWIAEAGYDPAYGARPVRRAVRQHLLNPLARALIGHEAEGDEPTHVLVDTQPAEPAAGGVSGGGGSSVLSALGVTGGGGGGSELQPERSSMRIRVLGEGEVEGAKAGEDEWH